MQLTAFLEMPAAVAARKEAASFPWRCCYQSGQEQDGESQAIASFHQGN